MAAVAVKTSPGAKAGRTPVGVALISLVGVVYVLACLAVVFKLLPAVFWPAWISLVGQDIHGIKYQFVGGTLLLLLGLALAGCLLWLGGRLLGKSPPEGVRAGVFVAFAGLLLVVALTRYIGTWVEYYTYDKHYLDAQWGAITVGVLGGLLLAGFLRLFTLPWTQRHLVTFEEMGWFSTSQFKSNQGRIVRRATIIGLLLLAGAGVYALMAGGTLRHGGSDWLLNIPFTGTVAVKNFADAKGFVEEIPAAKVTGVEVTWQGATALSLKKVISLSDYQAAVNAVLNDEKIGVPAEVKAELNKAAGENPVLYLEAVNLAVEKGIKDALSGTAFHKDIQRRMEEVAKQTDAADGSKYVAAMKKEAEAAKKTEALGWVAQVPLAVPVIDRDALTRANDNTKNRYVKVGITLNPKFFNGKMEGKVVPAKDFDAEEVRIYTDAASHYLTAEGGPAMVETLAKTSSGAEFRNEVDSLIETTAEDTLRQQLKNLKEDEFKRDDRAREAKSVPPLIPDRITLKPATGTPHATSITLLPSVQFTLPLLLMAGAIWLAWRAVNYPAFADFLIATEAEMNKVSWTTQKRLVQDTIVVLVTCFLMAVFLFGMDYFWKTVLSWKPIGVLHIPDSSKNTKLKLEDKKW